MGSIWLLPLGTLIWILRIQVAVGSATAEPPELVFPDGPGEGNEGDDILLTPEQEQILHGSRKAISYTPYRWPNNGDGWPEMPYAYADALVNQTAVDLAVAHWVQHTCIRMPQVDSSYSGKHIFFQRHASSCNSYVGAVFSTGQPINVPEWCEQSFGSLVHEIGHAAGLFHEQSRSDRNDYVNINTGNINSGNINNFDLESDNNYSVPYDYSSDMHYGERAFQINGQITIATKNPLYQGIIGQRGGLSHMDKLIVNRMYPCIEKWLADCSLATDPCQNDGYTGSDCNCVCPDGTSGSTCETVNTPYSDTKMSSYSEEITTAGTVTSPNYPSSTPAGEKYTKWIKAPSCKKVQAVFNDFLAINRYNYNGVDICYFEGLEIRTDNMYDGTWYCGSELSSSTVITSASNEMILFFKTNTGWSNSKWTADITFVDDPSCGGDTTTTTTSSTTSSTSSSTSTTSTPIPTTSSSTSTVTGTSSTMSTVTSTPTTASTSSSTRTSTSTTTVTSTSTTSSSTSTTSSSTSTTSSSTSTTSTATPSTTTTSSTTASTTTTTQMSSGVPQCRFHDYQNGVKAFSSPNYPYRYPNNAICEHQNIQPMPLFVALHFSRFRLSRGDKLTIDHPYGRPIVLRGKKRRYWVMNVPANFRATFTSDSAYTQKGFFVRYYEAGSRCHRTVNVTTPGVVTTPSFPYRHQKNTICEWKFMASPGKRVSLYIWIAKVKCRGNYLAIDKTPYDTVLYDSNAIDTYCGRKRSVLVTSTTESMVVFYNAYMSDRGVKIVYREIP